MKKLLILAGVMVLTSTSQVFANEQAPVQSPDAPKCERRIGQPGMKHRPPHFDMKKFEDELNLTDAQKEQAKQLREKEFEAVKPLMDQMKEIHKQYREEFKSILTEEQQKKLEELKAQRKDRCENGPRPVCPKAQQAPQTKCKCKKAK